MLPPGVPSAARDLTLALGLALVWLSRSLARGRRRAWQLAVVVVIASAISHLAKGLDFEESSATLVLLAVLWRTRRDFRAPGDADAIRPLVATLAALFGVLPLLELAGDRWHHNRIEHALGILAGLLAARALGLWLRPVAERARQSVAERSQAERLVREHGRDSLAFFALRRDKSYFFSPSGRSFLAYRVLAGTALIAGDPIGEPSEHHALVAEFRRVARAKGWRTAIAGAGEAALPVYRRLGLRTFRIGDEAIVRPPAFTLEGRSVRKIRQSVSRLERCGYRVRVLRATEADPALRAQLLEVSQDWRGRRPERGFTMAMDALFAYDEVLIAVAEDADGRIGGFLQLVPALACNGLSLASMRRRRETPNGLMEFLIARTLVWARDEGVSELSLNFAVFGETLRAGPESGYVLRFVLRRLDRVFQIERLHSFNQKFRPEWRPRWLCLEAWSDLPAVGLAYLHAESLLTPPGPWVRTPDLAAR